MRGWTFFSRFAEDKNQEALRRGDLIAICKNDNERGKLKQKLLRFRLLMEERGICALPAFERYEEQIRKKMDGE
jgi:hypothetical protein